ncbi:MAG TPA: hypothetical protein VIF37_12225 [Methylobacter sp.]|jgi:hypothetical protein
MWKLWKTQQPSALAKGIATIPFPGEKSDHEIHAYRSHGPVVG